MTITDLAFGFSYISTVRTYAARMNSNGIDAVRLTKNNSAKVLSGVYTGYTVNGARWSPLQPELGFNFNFGNLVVDVLENTKATATFNATWLNKDWSVDWAISPDGQYLYHQQQLKIFRIDRSGNNTTVVDLRSLGVQYSFADISVGDRYLSFYAEPDIYHPGILGVYDLQTSTITDSFTAEDIMRKTMISHDGKYVASFGYYELDVYSIDDGKLTLKKTFNPAPQDAMFSTTGSGKLLIGYRDKLVIYDPATDQSDIKTYSKDIASNAFLNNMMDQDPISGHVLWLQGTWLYVIDPDTGELTRQLNSYGNSWTYRMYNNIIYRDNSSYDPQF
jgi:hypothetical protein